MRSLVLITCVYFCLVARISAQTFSLTYNLAEGSGDFFTDMYLDEDTIYTLAARGCDTTECMTVVKFNRDGEILRMHHFPWMDEGDNDAILKDDSLVLIVGSQGQYEETVLNLLILNTQLDSVIHRAFAVPDNLIGLGIRSVESFLGYYVIVGFAFTPEGKPAPATLFLIEKQSLEVDTILSILNGSEWTTFSQVFVQDSQLIVSYLVYSGGVFLNRGFLKFDDHLNQIASWESEPDSYGLRGEDALLLDDGNMLIEHAVDNRWREFRLICVSAEGEEQWIYDDQRHPFGRKDLYHLAQTRNGDIIGCGEIIWPKDPTDITSPVEDGWHEGGYLFRMNSQTGEMIWEHAVVGYDSFWNFAGDFLLDVDELSDGSLIMCGGWTVYHGTEFLGYNSWLVRTDSVGCVVPDCGFPSFTTTTVDLYQSINTNNIFTVAPNPAENYTLIILNTEINVYDLQYSIRTIDDKLIVQSKSLPEDWKIDIFDLPDGLYFISVSDLSGRLLQTAKFVKTSP